MLNLLKHSAWITVTLLLGSFTTFAQQPPTGRSPLTQEEIQLLLTTSGTTGPNLVREMQAKGKAGNLTQQQLATFRQRGVREVFILEYLDEFGVTPEESDALKRIGVNLENPRFPAIGFWAALADVVCMGRVSQRRDNPEGPYHSYVDIESTEYLKNLSGRQDRILRTRLLSGPRYAPDGKLYDLPYPAEPALRSGEKVIVFLTSKPVKLRTLLSNAEAYGYASSPNFESQYGTAQGIRSMLNQPGPYEVLAAWKIVGNKAVTMLRGYRIPNETDVISLDDARRLISSVSSAQRPFRR